MSQSQMRAQVQLIQRYHAHLQRLGRASRPEDTFRMWAIRFAGRWAAHAQKRGIQ